MNQYVVEVVAIFLINFVLYRLLDLLCLISPDRWQE